jgi:hypothetical protein
MSMAGIGLDDGGNLANALEKRGLTSAESPRESFATLIQGKGIPEDAQVRP